MSHLVVVNPSKHELEIKKSKFIAYCNSVSSRADAMDLIANRREAFPDARHHCWAYLLGSPHSPTSMAMSDDGEPSGSAGKPIANVLAHGEVGDVLVVVTRYFGGIKLGVGGLVRAYSEACNLVIQNAHTAFKVDLVNIKIQCEFSQEQMLRHFISIVEGKIVNIAYSNSVIVTVAVPKNQVSNFNATVLANKLTLLN